MITFNKKEIFAKLREFLMSESLQKVSTLAPETNIISEGWIDSMGIFKLIAFVEEDFGVSIEPDELLLENFETPNAIISLIERKSSQQTIDI
jgi:acyl carrier protein